MSNPELDGWRRPIGVPAFRGTFGAIPGTGVVWVRRSRLGPDGIGLTVVSPWAYRLASNSRAACVAGLG
jgi:hypothetical protein